MGNETVTQVGLKIVKSDPQNHILLIAGSVPGGDGDYVLIRESIRK